MLTPEQAQRITDLRQKMLRNVAEGKPAHADTTEAELAEALSFVRSNRSASVSSAQKPKKASKAKKSAVVVVDTKAFTDIDLD